MNDNNMLVLLTTEGTYPYHQGGVSTWCDILVNRLEQVDFVIYSIMMNPFVTQKFKLPERASLYGVPLWGTEEPSEHLEKPFADVYAQKLRTGEKEIRAHFLPLLQALLKELTAEIKDPYRFADTLVGLYRYFEQYEYKATFKHELVWEYYKATMLGIAADRSTGFSQPDIHGLIQSLGWVYRFFNIVNTPVPRAHVAHSSAAAFCGIPCVLAKKLYDTPYLLTEHGIYLREQYLSLSGRGYSTFLTKFLIRMIQSVTSLNYAFADQVSPVCLYNTRWESELGISKRRIEVIYNGIDTRVFKPDEPKRRAGDGVTIAMVARIDPIKDIKTFLRAARIVLDKQTGTSFVVYGSVSVPAYYEECLALQEELRLGGSFVFAGHATQMAAAYNSGDVIVLSSISEAFPYSVVEAMMTGKPVVATDVGGISEALGDTGKLVEPRNPQALADAILAYADNPGLRAEAGREGRERALSYFTLGRVLELHMKSYIKLAARATERIPPIVRKTQDEPAGRQGAGAAESDLVSAPGQVDDERHDLTADGRKLAASDDAGGLSSDAARLAWQQQAAIEEALLLAASGQAESAVAAFREALAILPDAPCVPYILTELAGVYNALGRHDEAMAELLRCELYASLRADRRIS
ncbi:GT4 family glycosyltransferase PelF [Paenibacillus aurantiacus]|uniref:GT4 family glycosyltransferase PelF n=1 Tax=Paenibacillus aurantiacus TaxID=1936118 RepID=A0ABV5KIZ1_9BACL